MKRGQGTTMSLEEFVKLAMSVFLAGILITIIATVYLWWASPDLKSDATAINSLENLVGLINAQEGEEWETKTIVKFISEDFAIIGFAEDTYKTPQNSIHESFETDKPTSCDESCFCVYSVPSENENKLTPIACENIEEKLNQNIDIRNNKWLKCYLWTISKNNEGISFSLSQDCQERERISEEAKEVNEKLPDFNSI